MYISVQQVRDAGVTVSVASNDEITASILGWQQFIDRATDQFFEPRVATVTLDGTDSDTLHFGVPIISISAIRINNNEGALNTDYYRAYTRQEAPNDDRRNPRIKLVRADDFNDIYTGPVLHGQMLFRKGRQNQEVSGTFGFTELGGAVPFLIQRALLLLVIEKLTQPIIPDPCNPAPELAGARGPILEETTDGHKLKYQARGGPVRASAKGLRGITENPEVHDCVRLYKAPLRMATPANWSFR